MPRLRLLALLLGAQSLVTKPSRRPRTAICAEPPSVPQDLPFDIQRRVDEAKRRQTERRTEDTQRKRLRKKELLKALQLAKLRRQFSAFGFDDVDRELKRVAAARRDQDSFSNITVGDKASWLGPLAEGLLPPKPADETPKRVVKLNRPPVAKGLKFPKEEAHPPPAPAPPVGASGLRPVPPKPGLPKLPSEPLPSLKVKTVVKTKSEVYEPLTERETTGGMARDVRSAVARWRRATRSGRASDGLGDVVS